MALSLTKATKQITNATDTLAKSTHHLHGFVKKIGGELTSDRFAKSTQHLVSFYSKSFAALGNRSSLNDSELSPEEIAIRGQINFERLLFKTLEFVDNADKTIPSPHHPPLFIRIQQYYKSLEREFQELQKLQNDKNIQEIEKKFPKYQSDLNKIKNWIFTQEKIRKSEEEKNDDIKDEEKEVILPQTKIKGPNDWRLRKRRRVMRYSEKLAKEYEDKRVKNRQSVKGDKDKRGEFKAPEMDDREALIDELNDMVKLLKQGALDFRETIQEDKKTVKEMDEETYNTLDKVSALNNRLQRYVKSTTGMTCTMCLMFITVFITWIWCFFIIYFI